MFKAGEEIVAFKDHPDKVFKKGDIFIARGIRESTCDCMDFLIDIGFSATGSNLFCLVCKREFRNGTPIWWFSNKRFVPLLSEQAEHILEEVETEKVECHLYKK